MIGAISARFRRLDAHAQELFRGSSQALALRMAGAGFTLLLSLALARTLGASGAGIYFLAYGVASLAGVSARLGLGGAVMRFTSAGSTTGEWPLVDGLARQALALGAVGAVVTTAALLAASRWISESVFREPLLLWPLRIMLLGTLPFVLTTLLAQLLRGLKRIAQSLALLSALPPALTCVGVLALAPIAGIEGAAVGYLLGVGLTLTLAAWWWRRATPRGSGPPRSFPLRKLLSSSMPLFWSTVLGLLVERSPGLFLGFFGSAEEVGVLEVAGRVAQLGSLVLLAVNSIAGPQFAEYHAIGDKKALERAARRAALLSGTAAVPVAVLLLAMPGQIMGLFGARFEVGAAVLATLALGQLVNAGSGSVSIVLAMSGNERVVRNLAAMSVVLGAGLYTTLVPRWGMQGAAVSYALVMVAQNLAAVWMVRRILGIWTLPIPLPRRARD